MKDQIISEIAIYISFILTIIIIVFFVYGFITGNWFFISSDNTIDNCIPNYMGGCDF